MKYYTIVISFIFLLCNYSYGQKILDANLKLKLSVELLNKDLISKTQIRDLNIQELKYECPIPLTFGIYKYEFWSPHREPGLFIIVNGELKLITEYNYNHVYQKVNTIFKKLDTKYEDRLIYLREIFKVLHHRRTTGAENFVPDSLIDLDAKLDSVKLKH